MNTHTDKKNVTLNRAGSACVCERFLFSDHLIIDKRIESWERKEKGFLWQHK